MSPGRQVVSKRAIYAAMALIAAHVLIYAYVVDRRVLYDQGGFEGLLWWLVAFFVLPAIALLTLVGSVLARWIKLKNLSGE